MTEIEVIQEIHGLFEFRPNGDELLKNKPEKMSSELFLSLAEKYRSIAALLPAHLACLFIFPGKREVLSGK